MQHFSKTRIKPLANPGLLGRHIVTLLVAFWVLSASYAQAHFSQNLVVHSFLIEASDEATTVYQKIPAPMVFSDILQDVTTISANDRSALLYVDGQGAIRLSLAALAADPEGFTKRLAEHMTWSARQGELTPNNVRWRIVSGQEPGDWTTATEAEASLGQPSVEQDPDIASALIEVSFTLAVSGRPKLNTALAAPVLQTPPGIQIENHFIDLRTDPATIFAVSGQLQEPVTVSPSLLDRIGYFVWQGVLHVFTGLDHVFLITCVALSALSLIPLIWRLTGFTIGHSITLIITGVGWVATSAVFIAWVELAIAVTVAYTAVAALRGKAPSGGALFAVGLLHGFGFAFVLQNILGPDSPALVASLLAFNVGIEVAQIVIVLVVLAVLAVIGMVSTPARLWVRRIVLFGALILSLLWCVERVISLLPS